MYASYYGAYIDDYAILQTSVYMQFTYVEIYHVIWYVHVLILYMLKSTPVLYYYG